MAGGRERKEARNKDREGGMDEQWNSWRDKRLRKGEERMSH